MFDFFTNSLFLRGNFVSHLLHHLGGFGQLIATSLGSSNIRLKLGVLKAPILLQQGERMRLMSGWIRTAHGTTKFSILITDCVTVLFVAQAHDGWLRGRAGQRDEGGEWLHVVTTVSWNGGMFGCVPSAKEGGRLAALTPVRRKFWFVTKFAVMLFLRHCFAAVSQLL